MSGVESLVAFLAGIVLFTIGSKRLDERLVFGLLVVAGVGLYFVGPNPFLFGMFLASGWSVLSFAVDRAFPVE